MSLTLMAQVSVKEPPTYKWEALCLSLKTHSEDNSTLKLSAVNVRQILDSDKALCNVTLKFWLMISHLVN